MFSCLQRIPSMRVVFISSRRCPAVFLLSLYAAAAAVCIPHVRAAVDEIETVRGNLKRALEYRDRAAREAQDWRTQELDLDNLLTLAEAEARSLRNAIASSRALLDELERRRTAVAQREAFRDRAVARLTARIGALADALARQRKSWPEPLVDRTAAAARAMVIARAGTEFADARRTLDQAISLLEEAGDFQASIHRTTAMRPLDGGRQGMFEVIYIGLAGGYFYSTDLRQAGTINFDGATWVWNRDDALLEALARFSAIMSDEAPADLVKLPVNVSDAHEGGRP